MTINNLTFLIHSSRPKTLFAALSPCLIGLALAYNYKNLHNINFPIATLTILSAILLQVSSNLINDYYDYKNGTDSKKNRLGPQRIAQTQDHLKMAIIIKKSFLTTLIISLIFGIFLMLKGGLPITIIGFSALLFCYLYSAGPVPLSHLALGEVFAFLYFGPLAVWGTFFLQTQSLEIMPFILGIGPGLISASIMLVNNIRDHSSDKINGKITIATLNLKFAKFMYFSLIIIASFIPVYDFLINKRKLSILVPLTLFFIINTMLKILKEKASSEYNKYLALTAKFAFIYSLLFAICIAFSSVF